MKVADAKRLVLDGIYRDLGPVRAAITVHPTSPDPSDPGKFMLAGKAARVIHYFSGWHAPINLAWLEGSYDMPRIQRLPFHWYVFAIPDFGRHRSPHYLICDYLQVREWVLEFAAPLGRDHRNHTDWRADIHVDRGLSGETQAYFRWGDEPAGLWLYTSRVVRLDNVATLPGLEALRSTGRYVGAYGLGGESEAHRRLKLYISRAPALLHLRPDASFEIEHRFCTGDTVDVLSENHTPRRAVVEVEVEGEQNLVVGVHQAIKYRSLAASEQVLPLESPRVRAFVVSYGTGGEECSRLARAYGVELPSLDRRDVLAPTG